MGIPPKWQKDYEDSLIDVLEGYTERFRRKFDLNLYLSIGHFGPKCAKATKSDGNYQILISRDFLFDCTAINSWNLRYPEILPEIDGVLNSERPVEKRSMTRRRFEASRLMGQMALEFIYHHELAHIINGHLDIIHSITGHAEAIESPYSHKFSLEDALTLQALEMDADSTAVAWLVTKVFEQTKLIKRLTELTRSTSSRKLTTSSIRVLACAVASYFSVMRSLRPKTINYHAAHPPLSMRIFYCTSLIEQQARDEYSVDATSLKHASVQEQILKTLAVHTSETDVATEFLSEAENGHWRQHYQSLQKRYEELIPRLQPHLKGGYIANNYSTPKQEDE